MKGDPPLGDGCGSTEMGGADPTPGLPDEGSGSNGADPTPRPPDEGRGSNGADPTPRPPDEGHGSNGADPTPRPPDEGRGSNGANPTPKLSSGEAERPSNKILGRYVCVTKLLLKKTRDVFCI